MRRRRNNPESMAESFDDMKSDYAASKMTRFRRRRTGLALSGSGADFHYKNDADYLRIMEYARDMDRNDAVVGQLIDRAVLNTVQDGIKLDPQTGSDELDAAISQRWEEWATDCDLSGERTFNEIESAVFRATLVDGDHVALGTSTGKLQLVEGHRIRTPNRSRRKNLVHGVKLDPDRRHIAYMIARNDIDPFTPVKFKDMQEVATFGDDGMRQVFHVKNPKRVSQTRGVSALAPIFDVLGMFEDINFAKLVQQQIVSCFAILRMRDFDSAGGDAQYGERTTETRNDGTTRTLEGVAPGMEVIGAPGEKLLGFSPNVPNAEFFEHVRLILTLVGINLGLPLVLALLDSSETNFSGWRGAVDQARMGFRGNQRMLINRLHRPVYLWKLVEWLDDPGLARLAAAEGVRPARHRWNPPSWTYIEPLKDASSDLLRVRNALISPRRLHAERGRDWTEVANEIVEDNAMAIRIAMEAASALNAGAKDGQPVHWRELLSLPTPDGVQVTLGETGGGREE